MAPVTRAGSNRFVKFYFTFAKENVEAARRRRKEEHERRAKLEVS